MRRRSWSRLFSKGQLCPPTYSVRWSRGPQATLSTRRSSHGCSSIGAFCSGTVGSSSSRPIPRSPSPRASTRSSPPGSTPLRSSSSSSPTTRPSSARPSGLDPWRESKHDRRMRFATVWPSSPAASSSARSVHQRSPVRLSSPSHTSSSATSRTSRFPDPNGSASTERPRSGSRRSTATESPTRPSC